MEAYIMYGIGTVTTLLMAIFWKWVDALKKGQEKDRKKIDELNKAHADLQVEIYRGYQSKQDAHVDSERIIKMLEDIKDNVGKLNDKLDRKADK